MSPLVASAHESLLYRRSAIGQARELSESDRREVEEIDAALARIEKGDFGHCEVCGNAIGRLRLRAMPETRRCLHCT